ncbi:lactate 2-monooxygenase [Sphingobium sp. YR768]|nr:lactate 2-monooxygenase [Sphingobium sp. YR768]
MPRFPADFVSLEAQAKEVLPWWIYNYVAGGCGDEYTQRENCDAFRHYGIMPRRFRGSQTRDLTIKLFGNNLTTPLFLCPIGVIGLCSLDLHGDLRVAEASARTGVPMMVSTLSQVPMEEIAAALGDTPGYFQLYPPKDRDLALSLIRRAEAAGFAAISITLDTWVTGWRPRDINNGSFPQLRGHCLANYFTDENFLKRLPKTLNEDLYAAAWEWANVFGDCLSWDDLKWIRQATKLPIMLKGICSPDDARRAVDYGIDALQVSNHGGRQANGGWAAIDLLEDVVKAVDLPVLFDSGVRSGTDVVKALALGATSVGIGRPYAFALAAGGVEGVVHQLKSLLAEADLLMAIDGYPTIAHLKEPGTIARKPR